MHPIASLLIHEVGSRLRNDPTLSAQQQAMTGHHMDPIEAGQVFARIKPRLAVFSHGGSPATLPFVRQNYSGPVEVGEDLMTIEISEEVQIRRFNGTGK